MEGSREILKLRPDTSCLYPYLCRTDTRHRLAHERQGVFFAIEKCQYQCTENNFTYNVIYFGCKTDCSAGHSEECPIKDLGYVSNFSEDILVTSFVRLEGFGEPPYIIQSL